METIGRFFRVEPQSFFLLGPRGTGKSTFVRANFPDALYIDLLQPDIFRSLLARPERLREMVHGNPGTPTIVLDEIQKVPQLLDVVHALMEEDRRRRFVLTGSSPRKLKRAGADMLAGRALLKRMHPFVAGELGKSFSLPGALRHGMIPVVVGSPDPEATLQSYVDLYLREEIQAEGLTRNIGNFTRFLEAASFSHGSQLTVSNISRECGVERKTVEGYLSILEDLLLTFRVPVFTRKAKRATVSHPKFYFFDAGLYNALRPKGPLDRPEEIGGATLEGLVAQHLLAWIDFQRSDVALNYWRTRSGSEVDFVLYGKNIFRAIEVKNTATVHSADLRGLKTFGEDYPQAERVLVYRGKERLMVDGIRVVPCREFLLELK
ncbi:MAG: ATP-binding protein [bacterium]|nr:ATP-binding protein [bacterium]